MSRPAQSKAQNDANARTLRALVKQPENKTCVDCVSGTAGEVRDAAQLTRRCSETQR
jgi:stromal membrane-associated protein